MPASPISARECADLLLATIPHLMRSLAGEIRQQKPTGNKSLSLPQIHLLKTLAGKPRSLHELAERLGVTPSTMSRSIEVLVKRGWVTRQSATADRRQIVLSLTEEGREAYATICEAAQNALVRLISRLTAEERDNLYGGLRALGKLLVESQYEARSGPANCGARMFAQDVAHPDDARIGGHAHE